MNRKQQFVRQAPQQNTRRGRPLILNGPVFFQSILAPRTVGQYVCLAVYNLPSDVILSGVTVEPGGVVRGWYTSPSDVVLAGGANNQRPLPAEHLFCSSIELPCAMPVFLEYAGLLERVAESLERGTAEQLELDRSALRTFRQKVMGVSENADANPVRESVPSADAKGPDRPPGDGQFDNGA